MDLATIEPWDQGAPAINGPRTHGASRATPFFFAIPTTGDRPIRFEAEGLPAGLTLDATRGWIYGAANEDGDHRVLLRATNRHGRTERELRITIGGRLCLTPPMGWMSWYCWGSRNIDRAKTQVAADAMVSRGLAAHGFTYIIIDDGWQGERATPDAPLQTNDRFPDMPGLVNHIHSLGLKAGIYSTPWTQSYAGFNGSSSGEKLRGEARAEDERPGHFFGNVSHVQADARQWAQWGFDYFKYDWDQWGVEETAAMAEALRSTGRDFVYSLSNKAPFARVSEWARLANLWRTTGDADGTWPRTAAIGFSQDAWAPFAGPGHFNDLDCLMVDRVAWGNPTPKSMSLDEQRSQVTLWSLLASPLILGCQIEAMSEQSIQLTCNDDVLAVDLDPLGAQGHTVRELRRTAPNGSITQHEHVLARPLADGGLAVGLFNRGDQPGRVEVAWSELGLRGPRRVRDLWARRELGERDGLVSADLPAHGSSLLLLRM